MTLRLRMVPLCHSVGDPFLATSLLDAPSSRARSAEALRAILLSDVCEPSFTPEMIVGLAPHSLKHFLQYLLSVEMRLTLRTLRMK